MVWLTTNYNSEREEKLSRISPSLVVFEHEESCWKHLLQSDDENAIFLLVDLDSVRASSIKGRLQELPQIKHLYRMENFTNIDQLCFRLTHDLIKYYGQVGDQLKAEKRNQEAQKMFQRAQQLCHILF